MAIGSLLDGYQMVIGWFFFTAIGWLMVASRWLLDGYWKVIRRLLDGYQTLIACLLNCCLMAIGWLLGGYWMIIFTAVEWLMVVHGGYQMAIG